MPLILYTACSIDMMIARPDGAIDWLNQIGDEDYGYNEFVAGLDGVLMGRKTCDILNSLGPWPYPELPCVVLSRSGVSAPHPSVKVMSGSIGEAMQHFSPDARVWLVGGGEIVAQALEENLLDEMRLFVHPIVLGKGIALFPSGFEQKLFTTQPVTTFSDGLVELRYKREQSEEKLCPR